YLPARKRATRALDEWRRPRPAWVTRPDGAGAASALVSVGRKRAHAPCTAHARHRLPTPKRAALGPTRASCPRPGRRSLRHRRHGRRDLPPRPRPARTGHNSDLGSKVRREDMSVRARRGRVPAGSVIVRRAAGGVALVLLSFVVAAPTN